MKKIQAKQAVELALKDEKQLMVSFANGSRLLLLWSKGTPFFFLQEIEFPTSGLASVPGN